MILKKYVAFLVVAGVLAFLGGCSLSAPYPNRAIFTIDPGTPPVSGSSSQTVRKMTLRVRRIIAVPPYGATAFVYQTGPHRLDTDYYNAFAAPPGELLTAELIQWLRAAKTCETVTDGNGSMIHQWALEGRLQELDVDNTNPTAPEAVLEMEFVLLDETGSAPRALMEKTYTQRIRIQAKDAGSAAEGWSTACRNIFRQLTEDLDNIPYQSPSLKENAHGD